MSDWAFRTVALSYLVDIGQAKQQYDDEMRLWNSRPWLRRALDRLRSVPPPVDTLDLVDDAIERAQRMMQANLDHA